MFTSSSKLGLIASILACVLSTSQADEKALVIDHTDTSLKWGGCPAFIGEGCQISILHGDPAKKNVDIFFKVPPRFYNTPSLAYLSRTHDPCIGKYDRDL